jgi:hypothetical protein
VGALQVISTVDVAGELADASEPQPMPDTSNKKSHRTMAFSAWRARQDSNL